jgi:catechol 2,3-dioxygenase-like lactoylglutathione lyase family enzyme
MPVKSLDHVNLRTAQLDAMRQFYTDVLGMESGPRPPFSFNGAWMYCDGKPVVHLVDVTEAPQKADLSLEHYALRADGMAEFAEHLKSKGVGYSVIVLPEYGDRQLHVRDPDGNHIHVDFGPEEPGEVENFTPPG